MLSNKGVILLSLGIILVAVIYNHCTWDCVLKGLSYVPLLGNFIGLEPRRSQVIPPAKPPPATKTGTADSAKPEAGSPESTGPGDDRLFTVEDLSAYGGDKGLYLAVLGLVYDVQKGSQHYAKGQAYHHFAGRDASRAFVTGDFAESGLRDDVLDLKPQELLALEKWAQVYQKDYPVVGKLIGRYFDGKGQPTDYLKEVQEATEKARNLEKTLEERKKLFPPCNSEWLQGQGGRSWCSQNSGGIDRGWIGVPRQLFEPESGKSRCACVQKSDLDNPNLKEFENCAADSESCSTK